MKLLITGAGGMLGRDVATVASRQGHQVIALTHADLDVTDPARVERTITRQRPGAVINCAAWTKVDDAEQMEREASLVNGQGAGFIADAAAKVDAKLLYVSTDYVFDGTKAGPYTESDDPAPLQAYGRSKLAGERATALLNRRSFIVRSSWLFGPRGENFVEAMLRLGDRGGPVVVVHDQIGCPTYTGHLAVGLVRLIDGGAYGVHHMAAEGSCSWYEFAMEIFRQAEIVTRVMATNSEEMARPAKRPANSVLASGRETPIRLPPWRRGLSDYLARREQPESEEPQPRRRRGSRRQPVLDLSARKEARGEEADGEPEPSSGKERRDEDGGSSAGEDAA
jgi:dTDP-4-dehydrorhamnose reductase